MCLDYQRHMSWSFFVLNGLWLEVVVCFLDIGEIVVNHCLIIVVNHCLIIIFIMPIVFGISLY